MCVGTSSPKRDLDTWKLGPDTPATEPRPGLRCESLCPAKPPVVQGEGVFEAVRFDIESRAFSSTREA